LENSSFFWRISEGRINNNTNSFFLHRFTDSERYGNPTDDSHDVELTVEGIEGLRMLIKAGSLTRPDGTQPSPEDPTVVALNQVHFDKVPMAMPDGASPPFAWTLQPGGAIFDPPVQIIYPNMSALPAGSIAYFLSFNHDTMKFEIVATGSVSDDGSEIVTDPGAGLTVAGWGCNCPPYSVTGDCENCDGPCIDNGQLGGGKINNISNEAVIGTPVIFKIDAITDTGGRKLETCADGVKRIKSVRPRLVTVEWIIHRPDGTKSSGYGRTAVTSGDVCGIYTCSYTAFTGRDCKPVRLSRSSTTRRVFEDFGPEVSLGYDFPGIVTDTINLLASRLGMEVKSGNVSIKQKTRDCCDEKGNSIPDGDRQASNVVKINFVAEKKPIRLANGIPLGFQKEIQIPVPLRPDPLFKVAGGFLVDFPASVSGSIGEVSSECFKDDPKLNCKTVDFSVNGGGELELTLEFAVCDENGNECEGFDIDFIKASVGLNGKLGWNIDECGSGLDVSACFANPSVEFGINVFGISVSKTFSTSGGCLF